MQQSTGQVVEIAISAIWILLSATELWAALFGAVIGGAISYWIQSREHKEAKRVRDEDQKTVKQALANSLLFKVMRLYSNFVAVDKHFSECIEEGNNRGVGGTYWQTILPLLNLPDKIKYAPEEMAMLLSLKNDDLFNSVLDLDEIHNSTIDAIANLQAERREFESQLKPILSNGDVLTFAIPKGQEALFAAKVGAMDALYAKIVPNASKDRTRAHSTLHSLTAAINKEFGSKVSLVESKTKKP